MDKRDRQERTSSSGAAARVDVAAVIAKVAELCKGQPRRYGLPVNIDRLVVTSVNVPFSKSIDAETLAEALRQNRVPPGYGGHFERFLGELPLVQILRFCDRHKIGPVILARFFADNASPLALRRPDLKEHLDALVPRS